MKYQSYFTRGLLFTARSSKLRLTLLAFTVVTVSFVTYVLVSQSQSLQLHRVISTNKEQQNQRSLHKGLINTDNEPFGLKFTTQHTSPTSPQQQPLLHRTYLISRTRCTEKVFLLIVVLTAPANFDKRTVIRKTWGTDPSIKIRWKTIFLLGQAAGDSVQNEHAEAEGLMYRDFVRGSQKEHYDNLTLKTQMGLEWAAKYCDFQFLLKTDDDVFIDTFKLIDYLEERDTSKINLYMGICRYDIFVLRRGKNGVSRKEYNGTRYPPFCVGAAYVLSSELVSQLVELFDVKKPFKNEDVYIGMLVQKIGGVKLVCHPGFHKGQNGRCLHLLGTFAMHVTSMTKRCMEELFNEAMKERIEHESVKVWEVRTRTEKRFMNQYESG